MHLLHALPLTLAAMAAAVPAPYPHDIGLDTSVEKRDACAPQPTGVVQYAVKNPDSAAAFSSHAAFTSLAVHAATPSGYSNVFTNLNASTSAYGYLGYTTLSSYDTNACAAQCNSVNGCMSFNIYLERDPSVDPGTGNSGCANPPSVTMVKCALWEGPVSASNANNYGQWRNQFDVVITASNGYVSRSLQNPPGYYAPTYLGSSAINAPFDAQGYDTFMGSTVFSTDTFDASLCADYCHTQNLYNTAHPAGDGSPPKVCHFFNTYLLYKNTPSNVQGQTCALYTESWDPSYATNSGSYSGSDHYMIESSYSYSNATNAGVSPSIGDKNGAVHQASVDITYSTLQPFCSTFLGYAAATNTLTSVVVSTPLGTSTLTATNTATALTTTTLYSTITYSSSTTAVAKRSAAASSLSTPAVLTKYPATVISSACSLQVSPTTATVYSTTTSVAPTSYTQTTTSTTVTGATSTVDVVVATTVTAAASTPTAFQIQVRGGSLDGQYVGSDAGSDASIVASSTYQFQIVSFLAGTTDQGILYVSSRPAYSLGLYTDRSGGPLLHYDSPVDQNREGQYTQGCAISSAGLLTCGSSSQHWISCNGRLGLSTSSAASVCGTTNPYDINLGVVYLY